MIWWQRPEFAALGRDVIPQSMWGCKGQPALFVMQHSAGLLWRFQGHLFTSPDLNPRSALLPCSNVSFVFSSPPFLSSPVAPCVYPCGAAQWDHHLLHHPPSLPSGVLLAPPDSAPHSSCVPVLSRREFARWKVRNTAIERRDLLHNPLPLMPEFQRSIRLLGRRPTTQQFIDTIIKKYGTHILISATLGGRWTARALLFQRCRYGLERLWATPIGHCPCHVETPSPRLSHH